MRELYDKAITDASLDELANFAKWMNEKVGHTPVIVGGWAAYAYVGGFGSKDIDVIFPNGAVMSKVLADYFHREGYSERRRDLFQKEYYKEVAVKGQKIEIMYLFSSLVMSEAASAGSLGPEAAKWPAAS